MVIYETSVGDSKYGNGRNEKMIELRDAAQLSKAIERAKAGNLFVQPSSQFLRQYHVTNRDTGAKYVVDFFVRKSDGKRFGHCTCKAGQNNIACKHIAAACGAHVMRMAARREAERVEQMRQAA
jgi:SWIM zinc finger